MNRQARSYTQDEVIPKLREFGFLYAAFDVVSEAAEPGAEDWRIILTAPQGEGEWRTLDEIGKREIDVRWHGGELIEDCPLIAKLRPTTNAGGIA